MRLIEILPTICVFLFNLIDISNNDSHIDAAFLINAKYRNFR